MMDLINIAFVDLSERFFYLVVSCASKFSLAYAPNPHETHFEAHAWPTLVGCVKSRSTLAIEYC